MADTGFTVAPRGDREIVMTRAFDTPRALVFDAFTKPELVRRWLLGPDGWSMPVCEIDLRAGGRYRYVWKQDEDGRTMGIGGVFREVSPPAREVHTETFDEAWYPGECAVTTVFEERRGRTEVAMTLLFESREARDVARRSGMETGVARSYDRLAEILDEPAVVRTSALAAAVIHLRIPRADMPKVFGPAVGELVTTLAAQGVAPAGPVFAHHLRLEPGVWDFEIGLPVASPVSPAGRVKPGTLPEARVARTVHPGPYEGLGPAWQRLESWIAASGHEGAPDFWEVYVRGPESGPDPAKFRTELNRPLIR